MSLERGQQDRGHGEIDRDKSIAFAPLDAKSYSDRDRRIARRPGKPVRLTDDGGSHQKVPRDMDIGFLELVGKSATSSRGAETG